MSNTFYQCREHTMPAHHIRGYFRATANSEEEQLQLAVKQYVPLNNASPRPGDVTIIACHAAGFFKEMYEPFFDDMYRMTQRSDGTFRIRGIWIADVTSHGASGILNEGRLGNDYCWDDHARDLLSMINIFRDQMPVPLVGLGHSMGAVNIIQLSLMHPRLLTTVVCIEPPIYKEHTRFNYIEAYSIMKRRDIWASRQDAVDETGKGGLQRSWDRRVLERWGRYAFREIPTLLYAEAPVEIARDAERQGSIPVTLSTTKHHTARAYCRGAHPPPGQNLDTFVPTRTAHPDISKKEHDLQRSPLYRPEVTSVFTQLPVLRPSCLFIYGADSTFFSSSSQSRADKLRATGTGTGGSGGTEAGMVDDVLIEGVGHFIPFEKPALVAEIGCQWMSTHLKRWKAERSAEEYAWAKVGVRESSMVEGDMMWWAQNWYSTKSCKVRTNNVSVSREERDSKL